MLSPDINKAKNDLTEGYKSIVSLDGFAFTTNNLKIVKLPKDPDWLPAVREEVELLNQASGSWTSARPNIWAPVLVDFKDYITTFDSFAEQVARGGVSDKQQWITLLEAVLLPALKKAVSTTTAAKTQLEEHRSAFSSVLPEIDKSIQKGWDALAGEEQQMLQLATELGSLNQLAESLGAQITTDSISGGKGMVSSAVSMLYAAGSAGAAATIPVLGIVVAVFAIGKSFYDIIKDDDKLIATMRRITEIQNKLSDDAQGLALTKGTLQILYNLELKYLAATDALPTIIELWIDQQTKVQDAINALNAGAQPDQYLDLLTIPTAKVMWQAISDFVAQLETTDIQVGQPVTLDIGKATIKPTFELR